MIEVENIRIDSHDFIGVYLNLPQYPIHFIMSTRAILAQDYFSLEYFEKKDKHVAVILCRYLFGFDGLLASVVIDCNKAAKDKGVCPGMEAKEALVRCEEDSSKTITKD